jgi:hypothetical protein
VEVDGSQPQFRTFAWQRSFWCSLHAIARHCAECWHLREDRMENVCCFMHTLPRHSVRCWTYIWKRPESLNPLIQEFSNFMTPRTAKTIHKCMQPHIITVTWIIKINEREIEQIYFIGICWLQSHSPKPPVGILNPSDLLTCRNCTWIQMYLRSLLGSRRQPLDAVATPQGADQFQKLL